MSRILFDAFDLAVSGDAAVDVTNDFVVQAINTGGGQGGIAVVDVAFDFTVVAAGASTLLGTAAANITSDFAIVAAGDVFARVGQIAVDITNDLTVATVGVVVPPIEFTPPNPGDPRVAVITHRN